MSGSKLYTPATGVQDRRQFLAMLDRIGIDSYTVIDETGHPTIALDRAATQQLRDWFADHGDTAQADAIQRALDEETSKP